jgi:hypothetical protein
MPEHRLHARQRMVHPLLRPRTEQPGGVVRRGIHPFARSARMPRRCAALLRELPAHPVDDRRRVEGARVQPDPVAAIAALAREHDAQLGADESRAPRRSVNSSAGTRIPNAT